MGRIFGRYFSGEIAFREADPLTVAGCLHQGGNLGQGGEGQQQADGSQDTAVDDAHRWTDEASNDEENTCYQCNVEGFHFFLLLNWVVPFFWLEPKEPKVQGCTGLATSLFCGREMDETRFAQTASISVPPSAPLRFTPIR